MLREDKQETNEGVPLDLHHPEYQKLLTKIAELEMDGVSPGSNEYKTEVVKFVNNNRNLAEVLSPQNHYLSSVIGELESENSIEGGISLVHKEAFPQGQQLLIHVEELLQQISYRNRQGATMLLPDATLGYIGLISPNILSGLGREESSLIKSGLVDTFTALNSFGDDVELSTQDDERSLFAVGQTLEDLKETVKIMYRMYVEHDDTAEGKDISDVLSRVSTIIESKQEFVSNLIYTLRTY